MNVVLDTNILLRHTVGDDDEVHAGLQMMDAGGDFAEGVNAYAGERMASGAAVFV
jgi:hypothetical protein